MPSERSWSGETILETILSVRIPVRNAPRGLIHDIDAVSSAVTTRDTLRLAVKTKTKVTQTAKLTHGGLRCAKRVQVSAGQAYRRSALDTPVRRWSVGSQSWSLER
jgi:hypothetical protein